MVFRGLGYTGARMGSGRRLLIFWGVVVLLLGFVLAGCAERRSVPELLVLTDITPRTVGVSDRVDILGRDLPVGQVEEAKVVLRGDLYRPGVAPLFDQTIEIEGARLERDRVSFELDPLLLERFTGRGDDAKHTTFRGRVEVRLPGASASMPVVGSLRSEVTLDVQPRPPSKKAAQSREASGKEAQSFFGWTVEPREGPDGGMVVRAVRADSPAAQAGVQVGDVVLAFAGVSALDAYDLVPNGLEGKTSVTIGRGDQRIDAVLDTQSFRGDAETGLTEGVIVLATLFALLLIFGTRLGRGLAWLAHRLREEIARQRVHGGSFLVALLRAAVQDGAARPGARGTFSSIAPALVGVGISISFAALPFVELKRRAELDIGILYLVSITALLAMGLLTGGWSSGRSIIVGRARAVLEVLVCELPAACSLGAVVVMTGSLHVRDIVLAQVGAGGKLTETGGWPWAWNALRSPQLFFLFALFFVTALVDGHRETSKAQGRSLGSVAFFFAEWTHVFVMCGLGTIAFLGGYSVPGVGAQELYASAGLQALGCALFLVKCWLLVLALLVLRASLPRIRPDVVLRVGLKMLLPACLVALAVTTLTIRFPMLPSAEKTVGWVTMTTTVAVALVLVGWVYASARPTRAEETRLRARVNPFL